jgi:hypothetical protein
MRPRIGLAAERELAQPEHGAYHRRVHYFQVLRRIQNDIGRRVNGDLMVLDDFRFRDEVVDQGIFRGLRGTFHASVHGAVVRHHRAIANCRQSCADGQPSGGVRDDFSRFHDSSRARLRISVAAAAV